MQSFYFVPINLHRCRPREWKHYIQDDWSTRFLWAKNYRIDHIIKVFMKRISILPGLFSRENLLLCDKKCNIMGCYSENDQKIPKITHTASRMGSHICQAPNLLFKLSEPFEWTLIELSFNTIENVLCLGFISLYLCFFYVLSLKAFDIYAQHFE